MTKKDAARQVYWVAKLIRDKLEGDEDADWWVYLLANIAYDLDKTDGRYVDMVIRESRETRTVKLRKLIEHPKTPVEEREAAVRALQRLRQNDSDTRRPSDF